MSVVEALSNMLSPVRTQLMEVFVRGRQRWWVEAHHNVDVKQAK